MTVEECHIRAAACVANAALAPGEAIAADFRRLAAQWLAMARGQIDLGERRARTDQPGALNGPQTPAR
jgi:hypothetical protein